MSIYITGSTDDDVELEALRRDAERLDWLDRDDIDVICSVGDGVPFVRIERSRDGKVLGIGSTIRAAIDAAMRGEK